MNCLAVENQFSCAETSSRCMIGIEKIPSSFVDVFTYGDTVSNINLKHACFATFIIISKIYLCAYNKFSIIIITSVCCMYL